MRIPAFKLGTAAMVLAAAMLVTARPADAFREAGLGFFSNELVVGVPVNQVALRWDGSQWLFVRLGTWFTPQSPGDSYTGFVWDAPGWSMTQMVWWSFPQNRSWIDIQAWGYQIKRLKAN